MWLVCEITGRANGCSVYWIVVYCAYLIKASLPKRPTLSQGIWNLQGANPLTPNNLYATVQRVASEIVLIQLLHCIAKSLIIYLNLYHKGTLCVVS